MAEQSLKVIIQKLEDLFEQFNNRFYDGKVQIRVKTQYNQSDFMEEGEK